MNTLLGPDMAVAVAYGLNVLLTVTSIAVAALIAARSVLRHDASARYVVCLTSLVSILLAPILIASTRTDQFGLVVCVLPVVAASQQAPTVAFTAFTSPPMTAQLPKRQPMGRVPNLLLAIWATGAACGGVRLASGWRTAIRLRQSARPLSAGVYASALEHVQRTLGSVVTPIFTSEHVMAPVAVGLLKPVVILPKGLPEALTPAQLRHVLLHEYAHVVGRHAVGGIVQRLAGLLFWPHPLVVALCRGLARAREEVCDNVASQEDGAICYARTLLAVAQGFSIAPHYAAALGLLGSEISLEQRINA